LDDAYAVAGGDDEKAPRILRASPGRGIWMPPQSLGVARKPRSGPQTGRAALEPPASRAARRFCRPSRSDARQCQFRQLPEVPHYSLANRVLRSLVGFGRARD